MIARATYVCVLALLFGGPVPCLATPDKLFESDEIIRLEIKGPLATLNKARDKSQVYGPASLSYPAEDGQAITLPIELEVRGNYRRQKDVCRFVPLRVIFDKKKAKGTLFAGQSRLKLVTHCRPGSDSYEGYLIAEYLSYRVFNLLTDYSFRVRLVEVTYHDTDKAKPLNTSFGFFIENKNRLADRLGAEHIDLHEVSRVDQDSRQLLLVSVFQYMIGNTDWSLLKGESDGELEEECCHNAKLIKPADGLIHGVPYDFDFSGFVNAKYAYPTPGFPIRNVRQRYYRGFCDQNEQIEGVLGVISSKWADIEALILNDSLLDARNKKRILDYLEDFRAIAENPEQLQSKMLADCR